LLSRVVFVGAEGVGKTSLSKRIVEGTFSTQYVPSLGVESDALRAPIPSRNGNPAQSMELELYDLAGGPRAAPYTKAYFGTANLVAFVVDATRPYDEDLQAEINRFCEALKAHAGSDTVPILVVNKAGEADESKADRLTGDQIIRIKAQLQRAEDERHHRAPNLNRDDIRSICVSARDNKAIDALVQLIVATRCVSLRQKIADLFSEAIALFPEDAAAAFSPLTTKSAQAFRRHLVAAKARMVADIESGIIGYSEALNCAKAAKTLAVQVAGNTVKPDHVKDFISAARPAMNQSSRLGRIMGGLIGAALGVFIGVMIGVFAPPLGAFAAITLGNAIGAVGATLGGAAFGYLGIQFTLWRHPLSGMVRAARKEAEQNEANETHAYSAPASPKKGCSVGV